MTFPSRLSSRPSPILLTIAILLSLALSIQGAHVCSLGESSEAGVGATISLSAPMCQVCALAHSLLIPLILILCSLVPTRSRTPLLSFQARPFRRELRLDLRAPPVL